MSVIWVIAFIIVVLIVGIVIALRRRKKLIAQREKDRETLVFTNRPTAHSSTRSYASKKSKKSLRSLRSLRLLRSQRSIKSSKSSLEDGDESVGDSFSVYMMPDSYRGGVDTMVWKTSKEKMAGMNEMIIERTQHLYV